MPLLGCGAEVSVDVGWMGIWLRVKSPGGKRGGCVSSQSARRKQRKKNGKRDTNRYLKPTSQGKERSRKEMREKSNPRKSVSDTRHANAD